MTQYVNPYDGEPVPAPPDAWWGMLEWVFDLGLGQVQYRCRRCRSYRPIEHFIRREESVEAGLGKLRGWWGVSCVRCQIRARRSARRRYRKAGPPVPPVAEGSFELSAGESPGSPPGETPPSSSSGGEDE